tara:strand:+ start:179 stop:298 length:120 start_codon:yes stop_codon:yes gene_type:complete
MVVDLIVFFIINANGFEDVLLVDFLGCNDPSAATGIMLV